MWNVRDMKGRSNTYIPNLPKWELHLDTDQLCSQPKFKFLLVYESEEIQILTTQF